MSRSTIYIDSDRKIRGVTHVCHHYASEWHVFHSHNGGTFIIPLLHYSSAEKHPNSKIPSKALWKD